MQITMEALEQAFAPIELVGKGEITFKVNGTSVTLRRLLPEEESEIQKYAILRAEDESSNTLEYIERFKLATISHSIVEVGNLNLRGVDYVETGDVLSTGVAVKVARHVAMRKMLLKWASPIRIAMFRQYVELLHRVEDRAEEMVEFAPSNLESEIERLEERLVKMREIQAKTKESLESDASKLSKAIVDSEDSSKAKASEDDEDDLDIPEEPVQAQPAPVQTQPAPMPRQSTIPSAAKPVQAPVQAQVPHQERPNPANYAAGMDTPDSFVDMGDSGSMEEMINAENLRMLQRRQAVARGQDITDSPSVLSSVHNMRRPPHMASRDVHGEIDGGEIADELMHTGRTVDGVDTYRMAPPEEMAPSRLRTPSKDVVPKGINPRFTPPKKP